MPSAVTQPQVRLTGSPPPPASQRTATLASTATTLTPTPPPTPTALPTDIAGGAGGGPAAATAGAAGLKACVRVRSVFIRQGPGTSFRTSGSLKRGDCIDINGRSEDNLWAQFDRGWTSTTNLTIEGDMQTLPVVPPPTPQP